MQYFNLHCFIQNFICQSLNFHFFFINSVYGNYVKLEKILILLWVVWS